MAEGLVLRLFHFRPVEASAVFDATLRADILPELENLPGLVDGFVGRRGPDVGGERLLVSVWESADAMAAALDESARSPRITLLLASAVTDNRLEVMPVAVALQFERDEPARVLRVFRGRVDDALDAYADEVRVGATADGATDLGPCSLYLGLRPPNEFVTVSAWPQWASIEASTGSDVRHPIATRHSERIVAFDVDHFEILARLKVAQAATSDPTR